ncbi:MAG: hypothetical protein ABIQ95_01240, partial [Bdellovibrionia bacterium]
MSPLNLQDLSAFGQLALNLDNNFRELERLATQIDKLEISSDYGLDRAKQLLPKFNECSLEIVEGVKGLAAALGEARGRAEKAA